MPSPFFKKVEPSPQEALSLNVTAALLSLGSNFDDLEEVVSDSIWACLNAFTRAVEAVTPPPTEEAHDPSLEEAIRTATIVVSLLGFLDAASAQADFWKAGGRLALIQKVRGLISESFLIAAETALSTIRNAHSADRQTKEWKRYLRHYSAAGRPLGAMLLQRSFMWLLVAGTSLLVTEAPLLRSTHVLDLLMSMSATSDLGPASPRNRDANIRSLDVYATMAWDQMNYLDASADFVKLGSSWQQSLAFGVKSAAIISYLNCALLHEEAADVDVLMTWLEEVLSDPVQMADETLASVVLRSTALACRINSALASSVSRLLPRFIVQASPESNAISVASKSLSFVLQKLSPDAVITTLYTLGNVLSPGSNKALTNGTNGEAHLNNSELYPQRHSNRSSISLQVDDEEETAAVWGNVIQAVCGIAAACNDEKVTALAQSMLMQKVEKVNHSVDIQVVTGAAVLALKGSQLDFRSLLKNYARLSHEGVVEGKQFLLDAVSVLIS